MKSKLCFFAVISLIILSGCRKGEEDPLFSVYSREKRISGDWDATKYYYYYEEIENTFPVYTHTLDCTNGIFVEHFTDSKNNNEGTFTFDFVINKNGTYSRSENYFYTLPYDTAMRKIEEGNWYFVKKNNNNGFKNKEIVAFQPKSVVYSAIDSYKFTDYDLYIYEIIKLGNKEIKLKRSFSNAWDSTQVRINEDIELSQK